MERGQGFTRLGDDLTIPQWHPLAWRKAWQCAMVAELIFDRDILPERFARLLL